MSDDGGEYSADLPFWIDTDSYSDRDRAMFVCGVEFQRVYSSIVERRDWDQVIHTENESRVRMMCGMLGVPVRMQRHDEHWTHCEIPSSTVL